MREKVWDWSQVFAVFWLLPMHCYAQWDYRHKSAWEIAVLLKDDEVRWMPHLETGKDGLRFRREKLPLTYELDILCMQTVVIHIYLQLRLCHLLSCVIAAKVPRCQELELVLILGCFFIVPLHLGTCVNGYSCGYNAKRLSGAVQTIGEPYIPWW